MSEDECSYCSVLCFLATGNVATGWLAVECFKICRQAQLQATPSGSLSRAETDQFTPLQLSLQPFCPATVLTDNQDIYDHI